MRFYKCQHQISSLTRWSGSPKLYNLFLESTFNWLGWWYDFSL